MSTVFSSIFNKQTCNIYSIQQGYSKKQAVKYSIQSNKPYLGTVVSGTIFSCTYETTSTPGSNWILKIQAKTVKVCKSSFHFMTYTKLDYFADRNTKGRISATRLLTWMTLLILSIQLERALRQFVVWILNASSSMEKSTFEEGFCPIWFIWNMQCDQIGQHFAALAIFKVFGKF